MGVNLQGDKVDLVILMVFHQAVRVVLIVVYLKKSSCLAVCGKKGKSAIERGAVRFRSIISHGWEFCLCIHLMRYCS